MTAQLTGISSSAMPNPWPSTLFEADLASGVVAVFIRPFGVAQAPTLSTCSLNFVYHALTMPAERVQRRIDELLDQAELAIRELDWSRVRETSLSILAADAENEDAATFLAMADPHVLPSEAGTGRGAAGPRGRWPRGRGRRISCLIPGLARRPLTARRRRRKRSYRVLYGWSVSGKPVSW